MSDDDETHDKTFEGTIDDSDYGLIICGETGMLKGMWIPKEIEDKPVPESIVNLCVDYFGIDPAEFDDEDDMGEPLTDTLH